MFFILLACGDIEWQRSDNSGVSVCFLIFFVYSGMLLMHDGLEYEQLIYGVVSVLTCSDYVFVM